jgi:hypothetical protein
MADEIQTRLERDLGERFPPLPTGEVYGVRFTGDQFEIHLHDDGSLGWTHRTGGHSGTSTLPADVAGEMTTAIRVLLDREQWLFNRLVEREHEVADLKRNSG